MARSIRGWIRNLADGLGPPPGSVAVAATVMDDEGNQDPLNATDHALGTYDPIHTALSGDPGVADTLGHWGWDMEFSPGMITQTIVPDDPQVEYRKRFPDESAPIGKAYHSDLERLAWTGGRDGLVWNAIPGGHDPAVNVWSRDPLLSSLQGNWSIASFDANMSFSLRRGIGFVGGTVFSIEMGDLSYPYPGVDAAAVNATAQDRWDLVCLHVVTDPAAYNYGKQQIEVISGTPGAGIPPHPGQPSSPTGRRLALHALKVPANTSAYNQAFDLRRWLWMPNPYMEILTREETVDQRLTTAGTHNSTLNTALAANEIKLPMGQAFTGDIVFACLVTPDLLAALFASNSLSLKPELQGYDVRGELVAGPGIVLPTTTYYIIKQGITDRGQELATIHVPIPIIPSYHQDSGVSPSPRVWHRLRPVLKFVTTIGPFGGSMLRYQRVDVRIWPVA